MTMWCLALGVDLLFGEPPAQLHPVVWMGRLIAWLDAHSPSAPRAQLLYGVAVAAAPALAAATVGHTTRLIPVRLLRIVLSVLLLKTTFSVRALLEASIAVEHRLVSGDLEGAREALRSLVSRERATLDGAHVASAAIESAAENLSDSYVAPLCWYMVAGLPAALAYRAINTADAMVGYRGRYEYLGKVSARLDDLANVVPSRASALAVAAAAPFAGLRAGPAIAVLMRDGRRTASPNAGWPMAAAAGALGVWLDKPDHYRLGSGRDPTPSDIRSTRRLISVAVVLCTLMAIVLSKRR